MHKETGQEEKNAQPINNAVHQTRVGRFGKVLRWDGNFSDSESKMCCLNEHFLIEDELIGIQ